MISKEHHKHPKLTRPSLGMYGRNEWAILGTTCTQIQSLAKQIFQHFSSRFSCAYLDASHQGEIGSEMLQAGATFEYTDYIQAQQQVSSTPWNQFKFRQYFNETDLVVANGNHHPAVKQIVVIDSDKEASLHKRLGQLTDVRLFLMKDRETPLFDFIKEQVPLWKDIPVLSLNDQTGILQFFENELQTAIPQLNGLVLAGGKSLRMGQDKGNIQWHGIPQRDYVWNLLNQFCAETFVSCRPDQIETTNLPQIADSFLDLGPFGAILSAFRTNPDRAWLVLACDLPMFDEATVRALIVHRAPQQIATAFRNSEEGFPEPLATIWEPKSYPILLSFLAQGISCPRKVLINNSCKLLDAPNPQVLTNVNTPEQFEQMQERLKTKD
ncbi:MAG: NTP transferase domain-containing protein [Saprospiraceae bacterium]|nr:NTP transferase domain-containing protein [Saprospiraceae bacterium]